MFRISGKLMGKIDEPGNELMEVTFKAEPEELRAIAGFLFAMASHMEWGGFDKCSHIHLSSMNLTWSRAFPGQDIIVSRPIDSMPPRVKEEDELQEKE